MKALTCKHVGLSHFTANVVRQTVQGRSQGVSGHSHNRGLGEFLRQKKLALLGRRACFIQ